MRVFVVSQAMLERYNKFTRNCSCCCETAEAVETTAKSELSRSNMDSLATWILGSSPRMTKMYVLLSIITLLPTLTHAEQCTATPDCASLGYTQTSCPDGSGVKCPWNTALLYCGENGKKICADMGHPYTCTGTNESPSGKACDAKYYAACTCTEDYEWKNGKCEISDGLHKDLYYCKGIVIGIKVPEQNFVIALNDASKTMYWYDADSYCKSYRFCGAETMGRLPTKNELLKIHDNITYLQEQLQNYKGQQFKSSDYCSSSKDYDFGSYWSINPINGDIAHNTYTPYVRPVLSL